MQPTIQSNWWKRPLALMLSLVLVVSSLGMVGVPGQVQAASIEVYVSSGGDDTTGDGTQGKPYKTLQTAYYNVSDGGTIYLLTDITQSGISKETLKMTLAKNVTITTAPGVPTATIKRGEPHPTDNAFNTHIETTNGQLTLKNITIDGNYNNQRIGGRLIQVYNNSKVIIGENVSLQNSYSQFGGSAIYIRDTGSAVEMTEGEIKDGNTDSFGAVFLNNGSFTMTGGSITGNKNGGVHVRGGEFSLSGDAVITGNTDKLDLSKERNVYLEGTKFLTLSGDFTGQAGVTAENRMNAGSQFGKASADGLSGLENLSADNDTRFFAVYGANNVLVWGLPPSIVVTTPTGSEVYESKPAIEGTTDVDATVTAAIKNKDGNVIDTPVVTVNPDGTWSFVPSVELADGEYTVELTATKYGKTSTTTKDITVDTTLPSLQITAPTGNEVYESKPAFGGTTDVGATVTAAIKDKDGNVIDTPMVTVNQDGTWSFTPTNELVYGDYIVEVKSTKNGKTSTATKNIKVTAPPATPLATPSNVQVTGDTLNWDEVPNASSYEVIITDGEGITRTVSVPSGTTLDLSAIEPPLAPGEYTITVTAKSNDPAYTDSPASQPVSYSVPTPSATPLATPSNVQVTGDTLNWDAVPNASSYEVIIKDGEGNTRPVSVPSGTTLDLSAIEPPLAPGGYTITVTAKSNDPAYTDSPASQPVSYSVPTPPATPLATPSNVQVTGNTLNWDAVPNADSYEVIITDGEGTTRPVLVSSGTTLDLSAIEPPLTPGEYTITVTAKSNNPAAYTDSQASGAIAYTVPNESSVNKSALQAKVAESSTLEQSKYTAESWEQYRLALQKANEVLDDPTATQEEVDNALEKLTTAQNALVQVKGKGLSSLKPSTGTLNPIFQTDVTNYTMNVGYSSSAINLEAISVEAGANITTTVNGQPGTIGQIPLQVGENIIVITVKDSNGNERHYTLKVYREAYTGGSGNSDSSNSTPANSDTTTTIEVELEIDGNNPLEKTTVKIERTKHANGEITDLVGFSENNAKEAVEKAKQIGNNIARIVIPDIKDEVDKVTVELPKQSIQTLRDNGISLEISTDNVHIAIPLSSMDGVNDDFYFRLVPVKKEAERKAIEDRARVEQVVRETLQSNDVHAVARPMIIETNMPSRLVQLTLPLKGMDVPTDQVKLEEFLAQLAVFIEHSDGENKVVFPEVVKMAEGELGLRFTVNKFSTFTVIKFEKPRNGEHEAYIKGFDDGTFGPQKNATRAQIAGMIARILGYEGHQKGDYAPFKDVPTDHYAAGAIAFINERGIMNGFENGSFRPNEYITRAQMATVVANFKQLNVKESVAITFNDTKGHWAQWIIEANRNAGIIKGSPDGSFAPNDNLTRAQAVTMINRMFERGPLNGVTTPSFPDVDTTHWAFKDIEEAARFHYYFIDEDGNEQLSN